MAMCKECGNVVGVDEIESGICKTCIAGGAVPEVAEPDTASKSIEVTDFGNPFSFRGRSGRLDYFVYGVLLTYTLLLGGAYIGIRLESLFIFYGLILVGVIVGLASTVRRTRDREENIVLVIILSLIPYVGFAVLLYLLLAPGKQAQQSVKTDNTVVHASNNITK